MVEYGCHAMIHYYIGGSKGQLRTWMSPTDPIFWVHHAFLDSVFHSFQLQQPNAVYDGQAYSKRVYASDIVAPFNVRVQDIWNLGSLCVSYI